MKHLHQKKYLLKLLFINTTIPIAAWFVSSLFAEAAALTIHYIAGAVLGLLIARFNRGIAIRLLSHYFVSAERLIDYLIKDIKTVPNDIWAPYEHDYTELAWTIAKKEEKKK
jgi:hypothetical protein